MTALESTRVRAASRRAPATVGLDLRAAGQAGAVAVDARGALLAWALVDGDGDRAALAWQALDQLKVRARELRILVGGEEAPVGVFAGASPPGEREIAEALLAEGYHPAAEPAVAALPASRGSWLVTAGDGEALGGLADRLLARIGVEPTFTVDQLLVAGRLDDGSAVVEYGETGLLIAARPEGSAVLVRSLPPLATEPAAGECRETLAAAGLPAGVRVLGARRAELCRALAGSGLEVLDDAPPARGPERLPAELALAWRLAVDAGAPALRSPRLASRQRSLGWIRRATRAALAAALFGLLLVAAGFWASWGNRARLRALGTREPEVARQVEQVRRLGALAEAIEQRRSDAAGWTAPWPRLAETVATLARQLPPEVGWEKLAITDGALELAAAARGAAPLRQLELERAVLARAPGLINLSWNEPATDAPRNRVRQVFKATLVEPAAGPPGAS